MRWQGREGSSNIEDRRGSSGGGGGGRPNIAQAGGKNPAGVQAALEKAAEALEEELA